MVSLNGSTDASLRVSQGTPNLDFCGGANTHVSERSALWSPKSQTCGSRGTDLAPFKGAGRPSKRVQKGQMPGSAFNTLFSKLEAAIPPSFELLIGFPLTPIVSLV